MKKILAVLLITVSTSVFAWNNGGYYHGYRGPVYVNNYGYNNNWVAPAVAGVAIGALAARSYYAPPPVVYQQPVYVQQPVYIQQSAPAGYTQQQILDANCNCWRTVLVPN